MYKLKYLLMAQKDLRGIVDYISDTLKSYQSAMDFVDELDHSVSRLQQFPYSCKVYEPIEFMNAEYRILSVKNYLVFYVVTENEVEIHRIIYSKMNLEVQVK